jgi:hypothetical protein
MSFLLDTQIWSDMVFLHSYGERMWSFGVSLYDAHDALCYPRSSKAVSKLSTSYRNAFAAVETWWKGIIAFR